MDGVNALMIADILNPAPTMTDLLNPEPSSVETEVPSSYGWRATSLYKEDLRSKWGDTFRRAWFVLCSGWAVIQTTGYVATTAFSLLAANYYVGNGQGIVIYEGFEIGWWPALGSSVVVLTGVTSRACRWLAYTRPSPLAKLGDLCEQLKETMEDRA
ncbi:hypothetical protein PF005_g5851 [Phytophthora fragariae]|uniref:Uncharacterized protein n=1 Tax=Phytophthora fragariae TaxID=53985 RepID=A0A6A3YUX6_9STRA|nr:hypothetical protein PF005_g5851 [Phytophthora fragariae]